ncbi:alpha/beta hydrolase family protein [Peptoniphilus catoniae]|uniref:alpha/beta hydrolase family protein n=1 Tax=Peptoniphilus catoniae TaxID=1660341 RepID=UPI0010FCE7BF|nr:alpha/beta fold hydrolase [Peptoniphilus catoniae]
MYYIFLLLAIISLCLMINFIVKKMEPTYKKALGILLSFALTLVFLYLFVFPPYGRIKSDFKDLVETKLIFIKHPTNYRNYETEEGLREIPLRVWFPKDKKEDKLPVFIFSHGAFGVDRSNEILFEDLAAKGYVVISMSHPYQSFSTKLSNGKSLRVNKDFISQLMKNNSGLTYPQRLESFRKWTGIRLEDMNFLIDEILDRNLPENLSEIIDRDRIFLGGHSLGGSVALEIGRKRYDVVRAVVSLEAPFFGDIASADEKSFSFVKEDYPLPVLHFYSDSLWYRLTDLKGSEYNTNLKLLDADPNKYINIHIKGAGHLGLTDLRILSPFITSLVDGNKNTADYKDVLEKINSETLKFLNLYR